MAEQGGTVSRAAIARWNKAAEFTEKFNISGKGVQRSGAASFHVPLPAQQAARATVAAAPVPESWCYVKLAPGGAGGDSTTAPTWKYDIYSDEAMTTKLNGDTPLSPENSRARLATGFAAVAAADGSLGTYKVDSDGIYHLVDCQETWLTPSVCTGG